MRQSLTRCALFAVLLTLAGCRCGEPERPMGRRTTAANASARPDSRAQPRNRFLSGAQIVVAYRGADGAGVKVERTREKAKELAEYLVAQLAGQPARFRDLARKYSDCHSAARGGDLGAWMQGRMLKEVEGALERLKVGEVSKPLATPQGYRILRRQLAVLAGSQILVAWSGARGALEEVRRSHDEAEALARSISNKARAGPLRFAALARAHSDDSSTRKKGGRIGVWLRGRRPWELEQALDALAIGEVSRPISTPHGFYIVRREAPYRNR